MSRTTRRGKPSRQFHKYISLGIIWGENRRIHICHSYPGGWHNDISDEPLWKEEEFDTYDDYAEFKIRKYHMDYRPWTKCPGYYHRMDTMKQKRLHKAALGQAMRTGDFDVVLGPYTNEAKRMWEWW